MKTLCERELGLDIEKVGKWLDQPRVSVIVPEKAKELRQISEGFRQMLAEEFIDAEVQIKTSALPLGDVVIQIEAKEFIVRDMPRLCSLFSGLINFEIYPIAGGKIRFSAIYPKAMKIAGLAEL